MNKLYFMEVTEYMDEPKFLPLLSFVSAQKQKQINRYRFDIDKKLSLYSELIVRIAVCRKLNIGNDYVAFEKEDYGKPYLVGNKNFCFNISHTRNAVVVFTADTPVGVDIEAIKKADLKIARKCFTDNEIEYIIQSEAQINSRFFEIWTRKEAYIKYTGKGLSMPLNSFDVLAENEDVNIYSFEKSGYVISLCCESGRIAFDLIELVENEFVELAPDYI